MIDEKKLIEDIEKEFSGVCVYDVSPSQAITDFVEIVDRQPKVGEWIPVAELDLDHNQKALIKLDDGFVCSARFLIADYSNYCGFYNKYIGFLQCQQVVEWMPYREKVE